MYHPASEDVREEFVELYNPGPDPVNLAGWRFTTGVRFTFPAVTVPPGGYLAVAADLAVFAQHHPGVTNVVGPWEGILSNSGQLLELVDTATLRLPDGAVPVAFDWRSGFLYAVGLTHTRPSGLALSAGYWYGEETIPDARYKPIVPDVALHVVSAGLGWRWGAWELEAVYQVGIGPTRTVVGSEGGLADGRYTYLSHALSLAAGRKF